MKARSDGNTYGGRLDNDGLLKQGELTTDKRQNPSRGHALTGVTYDWRLGESVSLPLTSLLA